LESFEKIKEKLVPQIETFRESLLAKVRTRGEPKTIGTADVRHNCYAYGTMTFEWQTDCFIQSASGEAARWNNK